MNSFGDPRGRAFPKTLWSAIVPTQGPSASSALCAVCSTSRDNNSSIDPLSSAVFRCGCTSTPSLCGRVDGSSLCTCSLRSACGFYEGTWPFASSFCCRCRLNFHLNLPCSTHLWWSPQTEILRFWTAHVTDCPLNQQFESFLEMEIDWVGIFAAVKAGSTELSHF